MGSWRIWLASLTLAAGVLLGAGGAGAEDPPTPASRAVIEEIVREYLLKHPEVIIQSIQGLQERQRASQEQQAVQRLAAREGDLLRDASAPVGGNPAGDVTLVEFFDYRCSYCRSVADAVAKLVESDPGLRLVYKELPILGPDSLVAARAALAAHMQGKYGPFHRALMSAPEPFTVEAVARIAAGAGLDPDRLRTDMERPDIQASIQRNLALAQDLGITGTPTFVVGGQVVPGAVSLEVLEGLVARARAK
jgi:protein-disulfide isomerase